MAEINDLNATDANNTGRFPEGMAPSEVNDGARALEGLLARWARDFGDGFVTTGGSSTAYTAASNRTIGSYYDGLTLFLELHTAAGATPTLNVDSVGAQSMVWPDGTAVSSDLPAGLCIVCYDLTNTNWVVLSVARPPDLVNDTTPQLGGALDANSNQIRWSKGADVASASTLALGNDGNYFDVTGTTGITAIGAKGVGTVVLLQFDAALTLTHHATDLVLPGGQNITTAAGDHAVFVEYAAGDWRCVSYHPAPMTQGQAEAGTDTVPRRVAAAQLKQAIDALGGGTGKLIARSYAEDSAVATGTTLIPQDDTIPQNTEGDEYMTLAHTPASVSNRLRIRVVATVGHSNGGSTSMLTMALFQDSTADALAATAQNFPSGDEPVTLALEHEMAAGTTSSTTFKIRIGNAISGTTTFNGAGGARLFGAIPKSTIVIEEIEP